MANTKRPSARDRARANAQRQESLLRETGPQAGHTEATIGPQAGHDRATTGPQQGRANIRKVRLYDSDWEALGRLTESEGTSRGAVIRRIVREYLRRA